MTGAGPRAVGADFELNDSDNGSSTRAQRIVLRFPGTRIGLCARVCQVVVALRTDSASHAGQLVYAQYSRTHAALALQRLVRPRQSEASINWPILDI